MLVGLIIKAHPSGLTERVVTPRDLTKIASIFQSVTHVSFQLSILKILAGQPGGTATLDVIKQHLAVFYTSGPDWTARMKRLARHAHDVDLFGQKLVERSQGSWIITAEGHALLDRLEREANATDIRDARSSRTDNSVAADANDVSLAGMPSQDLEVTAFNDKRIGAASHATLPRHNRRKPKSKAGKQRRTFQR